MTDVLIIGAGPAGLATGATLRRAGVPFEILERSSRIADSWHRHYERLHLHTPKQHSALPFVAFPRDYPRYPSRAQFIAYLEAYARTFDLAPSYGVDVQRVVRHDGGWAIETNDGTRRAREVVIATGLNRVPNEPRWPGQDTFAGSIVHSSRYANGAPYRGQRVLVVGFGNSGAEIALDLMEHGARPAIAVRSSVNVVPRDLLGIPTVSIAVALRWLPPRVADALNRTSLRLAIGDLGAAGLAKNAVGPITQLVEQRRVPVIDVGTMAAIRRGAIDVRGAVEAFDGADVIFAGGAREPFDAVVLATGYTTGFAQLVPERGPGLHVCGLELARTGMLRAIAVEAGVIARAVRRSASQGAR